MSYQIEYTDIANYDLYWIIIYLSKYPGGHEIAKRKIEKIKKAVRNLEMFPKLYQIGVNEICRKYGIRIIPVQKYLVYYMINEEKEIVTIIRIISEKQNVIDELTIRVTYTTICGTYCV